jgi:hypothetical protein
MDTIKPASSPRHEDQEADRATPSASLQRANDVRLLDDWELVLVGGGDGFPSWP